MSTTTLARPALRGLIAGVTAVVARDLAPSATARAVADLIRRDPPAIADLLTEEERRGSDESYISHVLHAQREFSIAGVVWRPGQETVIHDHVAWCAFGVLSGIEHETLYRVEGDHLVEIGRAANHPGDASGFAPPGDIHKVRNTSSEVGVSLHVYGTDLDEVGSSVRRAYDLPVRRG